MIDLTQLQDQIKKKLSVIENQPELENTKSFFLGKKGFFWDESSPVGMIQACKYWDSGNKP